MHSRVASENVVPLNYEIDIIRFSSTSESSDGQMMVTRPKISSFLLSSSAHSWVDPSPWMLSPGIGALVEVSGCLAVRMWIRPGLPSDACSPLSGV